MFAQQTDLTPQASESFRSTPLLCALVASVVVHTGLAIATFSEGAPGSLPDPGVRLRAALLVPVQPSTAELVAVAAPSPDPFPVMTANAPSPRKLAIEAAPLRPVTAPPAPSPAQKPELVSPIGNSGFGELTVAAEPLQDRDRLGDLVTRQINEFPVELDFPARLGNPIVARYPPQALAEGREGSVAVWLVVDTDGTVLELHLADGDEEFAAMAVAALEGARFVPAHNYLKPIRYPLALEFRFVIDAKATASAATANAK